MNFTNPLRHQLRKNSLIGLGIAFFDSVGAYEFDREKNLADEELRPFRHRKSKRLKMTIAVLVIATSMVFGTASAFSQTAASVNDRAERSSEIHWPAGFSPDDSDLFAHNEIFIKAPSPTVWQHIVEAQKWPGWYPNSHDVQVENDQGGVLKADSKFEWSTFGLHITSTIHEFVPNNRLGWFGKRCRRRCHLLPYLASSTSDGCQVVTEEVAKGPGAIAFRKSDPNALHRGHELWLSSLKLLSEK